jgi:hypothetical protein
MAAANQCSRFLKRIDCNRLQRRKVSHLAGMLVECQILGSDKIMV